MGTRLLRLTAMVSALIAIVFAIPSCISNNNQIAIVQQPYSTIVTSPGTIAGGNTATPTPSPAPANTTMPNQKKTYSAYPPMVIDQSKQYTAVIETNKGKLTLELFAKDVPKTVNSFVFLARDGFFDGVTFHRVIPGFMAQGGDPTGTGYGDPGYKFDNEITSHTHIAGALSMANSGKNTNGSQFFICYADQHQLDGDYSVFGQLTEGMDVLKKLVNGDVMQKVTIIEKQN